MKKLLLFITGISLSTIVISSLVACTTNDYDKNNIEQPEINNEPIDLKSLDLITKVVLLSDEELNEKLILEKFIFLNKEINIDWNELSVIKNEEYFLTSLNENIYIGFIQIEIKQKTNINIFYPNIYLKLAEENPDTIIYNFKKNNPILENANLICEKYNNTWKILAETSDENYDGYLILKVFIVKDIQEVINQKEFKVTTLNTHEILVLKLIRNSYPELNNIKMSAIKLDKSHWSIIIDSNEVLYYGECIIELYI
ncbi:unknown lipoprotein [Mesoplasma florum L1]|uniref:Lipoprotein n=1 Tax=Mesoplasma florum (strain ATCC 33453 / NBRC 100688 / NCTC 11704 / L1) TaxID=265311 RepID=Q6F111_MESFL|nr:hypothetical protein [Mesoplasma florum]AAT75812.1 unknown lipoprotein [Mesoplasma florum L1]